jgi:glyoxylase-like metal-dependent hydrolase (beta-lactamase superfamily II)
VRITPLSTGRVRRKRAPRGVRRYFADDWSKETLPVNVFLIEHPDGLCLFDTGQTALASAPGYFPSWYPFFRLARFELGPGDEAATQLAQIGHDTANVRWVVLSHLHTDHVGGLTPFSDSELLVLRAEWEDAQGLRGRLRGYLPQYWPSGLRVRLVDFEGPPIGPFAGSHDISGDGSLVLVPTPGHTRGHMSVLVRRNGQAFLLGGDAAEDPNDLGRVAPTLADYCRRNGVLFLAAHDDGAAKLAGPHDDSR